MEEIISNFLCKTDFPLKCEMRHNLLKPVLGLFCKIQIYHFIHFFNAAWAKSKKRNELTELKKLNVLIACYLFHHVSLPVLTVDVLQNIVFIHFIFRCTAFSSFLFAQKSNPNSKYSGNSKVFIQNVPFRCMQARKIKGCMCTGMYIWSEADALSLLIHWQVTILVFEVSCFWKHFFQGLVSL